MSILGKGFKVAKNLVFGDTLIPQEFTIALADPQTEVAVWLHGMGKPIEVTGCYSTACCAPLTICISFDNQRDLGAQTRGKVSLRFFEGPGQKQLLGEIYLALSQVIPFDCLNLIFFTVLGSKNYCLPRRRLLAHYLLQAYGSFRRSGGRGESMTLLEQRAAIVTFIRPHPLALVSLVSDAGGNIFPMNLMGGLGHPFFAFALTVERLAGWLVRRAGRIAVTSVPLAWCPVAFELTRNHRKESIDWEQLPFALKMSTTYRIPVPVFATRVREMEIQKVVEMGDHVRKGSHTFFVARIVSDERSSEELPVNVVHGFYQCWRLRGQSAELKASVVQDSLNKRRPSPAQIKQ